MIADKHPPIIPTLDKWLSDEKRVLVITRRKVMSDCQEGLSDLQELLNASYETTDRLNGYIERAYGTIERLLLDKESLEAENKKLKGAK